MEKGPLDARVLRNLFLDALEDQKRIPTRQREDELVIKGYLVDPDDTAEPSTVHVLSELDRRARRAAA